MIWADRANFRGAGRVFQDDEARILNTRGGGGVFLRANGLGRGGAWGVCPRVGLGPAGTGQKPGSNDGRAGGPGRCLAKSARSRNGGSPIHCPRLLACPRHCERPSLFIAKIPAGWPGGRGRAAEMRAAKRNSAPEEVIRPLCHASDHEETAPSTAGILPLKDGVLPCFTPLQTERMRISSGPRTISGDMGYDRRPSEVRGGRWDCSS